jgi:hypothetical protein
MPAFDPEAAIAGYILHAERGPNDEEYFWAWEAVTDYLRTASASEGWGLVLSLLHRTPDHVLGSVAAGPLEDLVLTHGTELVEQLEREALRDERFKWALGGIWMRHGDLPPEVEDRIVAASGGQIHPLPADFDDDPPSRPDT